MSNFFVAVLNFLGTETVRTTAHHPQTCGQVERYNRTAVLSILADCSKNNLQSAQLLVG